jgi:hypothetical protein
MVFDFCVQLKGGDIFSIKIKYVDFAKKNHENPSSCNKNSNFVFLVAIVQKYAPKKSSIPIHINSVKRYVYALLENAS